MSPRRAHVLVLALVLPVLAGCATKSAKESASRWMDPNPYYVRRVPDGSITVDGVMHPSEPWSLATPCSDMFIVPGGKRPNQHTTFWMLYDRWALYLFVRVEDRDIRSTLLGRDRKLFNEDCVELMLDSAAKATDS